MENIKVDAKVRFGIQLDKYIKASKLTQENFAELVGTGAAYIRKVLKGEVNLGIENMEKYAKVFGVEHYEFSNPNFSVPTFEQMPQALRDHIAEQKQKKVLAQQTQTAKEEKLMKELLKSPFLRKPKTAEEIAEKLSAKIVLKPSRVKALLREKGLKELVKVVPGEGTYVLREFWKGE